MRHLILSVYLCSRAAFSNLRMCSAGSVEPSYMGRCAGARNDEFGRVLLTEFHHLPLQGLLGVQGRVSCCLFDSEIRRKGDILLESRESLLARTLTGWCTSSLCWRR
ncbi:UNVERIFIED_CONTAM: hypothetical protein Slati_2645600 [Sesamum latifolium]|uniref:Secreted protein n=1 Tax=Sesamum latifolium TaxID=2727402 RepID=A0AAW2VV99_9LAMI